MHGGGEAPQRISCVDLGYDGDRHRGVVTAPALLPEAAEGRRRRRDAGRSSGTGALPPPQPPLSIHHRLSDDMTGDFGQISQGGGGGEVDWSSVQVTIEKLELS